MKKIVALLMSFLLIFVGLTGCGFAGDKEEDVLKVGFIFIGSINDGGFTQAHNEGRVALETYFKGDVVTQYVENVSENAQDVKSAAAGMIDQGCSVIIGTSYGYMDTLESMAIEYPDVTFLHFSGNKMNDKNFGNFFGAMEEPRYLSGMIAGGMTKTDQIGYVAAFPFTEVQIGINAFALGVQAVNPNAIVKVVYVNSWYDPAMETEAANALLDVGCDVIAQHCDTTGPQLAAQDAGAYAIGYNLANPDAAPGAYLTAPVWNHGAYYISVVQSILDGKYNPESYYGGMADGYVALAPMSDNVPQVMQDLIKDTEASIKDGSFKVFSGEIINSDGTILCKAGQTLTREEIWKTMQVIKGVQTVE